jgi:hypothetical protein
MRPQALFILGRMPSAARARLAFDEFPLSG